MDSSNIYTNEKGLNFLFTDNSILAQYVMDNETELWIEFTSEKAMLKKLKVRKIDEIENLTLMYEMIDRAIEESIRLRKRKK